MFRLKCFHAYEININFYCAMIGLLNASLFVLAVAEFSIRDLKNEKCSAIPTRRHHSTFSKCSPFFIIMSRSASVFYYFAVEVV